MACLLQEQLNPKEPGTISATTLTAADALCQHRPVRSTGLALCFEHAPFQHVTGPSIGW
jgi:hypothetical protein